MGRSGMVGSVCLKHFNTASSKHSSTLGCTANGETHEHPSRKKRLPCSSKAARTLNPPPLLRSHSQDANEGNERVSESLQQQQTIHR
mmetsp:Transcript_13948/g.30497  ORF Transcript_13948/g.30497 Transcript_13948/m.30497 type:complete len:87 (+) Transcript_13948:1425-1685(+)